MSACLHYAVAAPIFHLMSWIDLGPMFLPCLWLYLLTRPWSLFIKSPGWRLFMDTVQVLWDCAGVCEEALPMLWSSSAPGLSSFVEQFPSLTIVGLWCFRNLCFQGPKWPIMLYTQTFTSAQGINLYLAAPLKLIAFDWLNVSTRKAHASGDFFASGTSIG